MAFPPKRKDKPDVPPHPDGLRGMPPVPAKRFRPAPFKRGRK